MNIAIVVTWNEAFATGLGQKRWYNMYKQAAKALGATHLLWVKTNYEVPHIADREIVVEVYDSFADLRAAYTSSEFVFMDANADIDLKDFSHPKGDVVYVIGSDEDGLKYTPPESKDQIVKISSSIELWSFHTLSIVLYDRVAKSM
jgi:hypothetical protein